MILRTAASNQLCMASEIGMEKGACIMAIHFTEEEKEQLKNDPSEIYQKRTEETKKQEIDNLSQKGKWEYFKDYYLKIAIICLIAIIFLAVFAVKAATRQPSNALYIAIQKDALDENRVEAFRVALEKHMKLDADEEVVTIDVGCSDHQLQAYLYSGTADIVITSEDGFKKWGRSGYFFDAETDSEVSFYGDYDEKYRYRTKYVTGQDVLNNKKTAKTEKGSDPTDYNCGLYLTESEKYRQMDTFLEKPVVGISIATERLTEAREFVQYMMDNSQKMEWDMDALQGKQ